MLAKRINPCLDVTAGRVVKGTSFVDGAAAEHKSKWLANRSPATTCACKLRYTAVLEQGIHPEKSGPLGLRLVRNFIEPC